MRNFVRITFLVFYFNRIPSEESKILCGNFEGIVNFQEMLYEQLKDVSEYVHFI